MTLDLLYQHPILIWLLFWLVTVFIIIQSARIECGKEPENFTKEEVKIIFSCLILAPITAVIALAYVICALIEKAAKTKIF